MFASFEVRKTASVIVCTALFSATAVLSAVGPARAVEAPRAAVTIVASVSPAHLPLA